MATRSRTSRKRISAKDIGAPALLKTETRPPGRTLYVDIDLGVRGKPPQCAIFIPDGFDAGSRIDIVLYLHGFNIPDGALSIDQYLKQDYGKLREGVNASGRNVILIAPTLGAKSQAGALVQPGGLDDVLGKSLAAIQVHGQLTGPPKILAVGNLILAGHSGGGKPVREIAGGNDATLASL